MPLLIFDELDRDLSRPRAPAETQFGYLNRSNRVEAARVRNLVEAWVSRYPEPHRASLIARLRSPIDGAHNSAFWELTLHELLVRSGQRILEIEPKLEHTERSPDYLVEASNGEPYYLEAVMATGKSEAEKASETRLNTAIQAIDQADAPLHFLDLHIEGTPAKPVTLKNLKRRLSVWIKALPNGAKANATEPFEYQEHGVRFTVTAIPRTTPAAKPGNAVGVQSMEPFWGVPGDGIRGAVEKKASRYGKLELPYVVAVNAMGNYQGERDAIDALFGSPCVVVKHHADGATTHEESRSDNGVWRGPKGARKRGLSAVLSTERLYPWSVAQRRARLIRNPWADRPLPSVQLGTDELNPADGVMRRTPGKSFAELFELAANWPEDGG